VGYQKQLQQHLGLDLSELQEIFDNAAFVCLCKALQREIQAINSSTCSEVSTKAASTGMWTAPPHVSRGVSAARNPRECGA